MESDPVVARRDFLRMSGALASSLVVGARSFAAPAADDWPWFRGPNHNGVLDQKLKILDGGPQRLWDAVVGGGHASMSVLGGKLFTLGSGQKNLSCLDAASGEEVWRQTVDTWAGDSTPAVADGRVHSMPATNKPTAYCHDAASGRPIWKRDLPKPGGDRQYGHAGSPRLWEDLVLLNAGGGAALKRSTGEVVWLHEGFPGLATPVVYQSGRRTCVALFGGDSLYARDARSGELLWMIPWKTDLAVNACDPIVFDDKIFVCSDYGRGRALFDISGREPREIWQFGAGKGSSFSSGFYHGGELYCFLGSHFACLDVRTGNPKWNAPGGTSALLIGDVLVCPQNRGALVVNRFSPQGLRHAGTIDLGLKEMKCVPGYWDGKVYVRGEPKQMVCVRIGTVG
jgi:outer membrane protein assembly factor BamB